MAFLFKYRLVIFLSVFAILSVTPASARKPGSMGSKTLDSLYDVALYYLDHYPDTSILVCNQGLELVGENKNYAWAAFHSLRGFGYEHLGYYRKALDDQFASLQYTSKIKDPARLGSNYNNIGVVYDYMGNLDSALYYYSKGYALRKKAKDPEGIASSASNLGLLYLNKSDFNRALDYLFEAKKIAESINDKASLSSCFTNIGLAYDKQGNATKALEYYMRSSAIDSLLNDQLNLALSYNNIGSIYLGRSDFAKALEFHTKSLNIRQKSNNKSGMSNSYHNLALVYELSGEAVKAKMYYEKALALAQEIEDEIGVLETLIDFGGYYSDNGQNDKAIAYLQTAVDMYEKKGVYGDIKKAYKYLSHAYAAEGNYKNAYTFNIKFHAIADSVQSYENSKKLTELEMESVYQHKKQEDAFKAQQRELKRAAEKKQEKVIRLALMIGLGLLLVVLVMIFRGYNNKKKANLKLQAQNNIISNQHKEIREQKNIIEEKNKDITDSIQYAQRLQTAILPPPGLLEKNLGAYFILYKPKDIVSGDFYWAHESSAGFLFAVVDCTGHGVPGSMVSIIANNALNRAVNEFKLYHPAEILNKLTGLVEEYFSQNKQDDDEIRDGMDISLCLLQPSRRQLEFAGANNSLWIVRNSPSSGPGLIEVKADKQPIGHYEHRKPYTNHTVDLQAGDMLYLHTDGYADQFGGENGKKFKSSRLKEVLLDLAKMATSGQQDHLENTLRDWSIGFEQNDDICLVGIRV